MTYRAWYVIIAFFVVFSCLVWAGEIFAFGSFLYVLASYLCYSVAVMLLVCRLSGIRCKHKWKKTSDFICAYCGKDLNVYAFFVWILTWPVGVAAFIVKAHLSDGWTEDQIAGCYVAPILGGFFYSMLLAFIGEEIIASKGEKE